MTHENVGEEYVRLALALDQHLPGYVDAYWSSWPGSAEMRRSSCTSRGAKAETVSHYLQHYGLLTEQKAHKRIEFLSSPLDRAYIFTYYWGKNLLKALFALKQERLPWYARLLSEAVTPTLVRQWMLE